MNFGIHSNSNRDIGYETALKLARIILEKGGTPVFGIGLENSVLSEVEGVKFDTFEKCDVIISIGGDGTFLSVISKYRQYGIPFVAINKGSIGFLAEISEYIMEDAIERIIKGNYQIIDRLQLKCELFNKDGELKGSDICLNDVSVLRGEKPHILKLGLLIDGEKVE